MKYRLSVSLVAATLLSASLVVGASAEAVVETTEAAPIAACFIDRAKLSDVEIDAFLSNPATLLDTYSSAGLPMTTRVRSLVGSSEKALDAVIALLPKATTEQQKSIGSGLARAAKACEGTDNGKYSRLIQVKLLLAQVSEAESAFNSTTKEMDTAVLGSGARGGGGTQAAGISGGTAGRSGTGSDNGIGTAQSTVTYSVGSGGAFNRTDENLGNSRF